VSFEDIRALAHPVLRHRVLTNFHAESEGKTSAELVDMLLDAVPVPRRACRGGMHARVTSRTRGSTTGTQFLDPAVLGRIGNLQLLAKTSSTAS
jgi:hypothetical protein